MKITEAHKQAVLDACIAITKMNKKPSTALVKTKLTENLPFALIIEGVNYFNANKDAIMEKSINKPALSSNERKQATKDSAKSCLESSCEDCNEAIQALSIEIEILKRQVKDLRNLVKAQSE